MSAAVKVSRHVDLTANKKLIVVRDTTDHIHALLASSKSGRAFARWRWTLVAGEWRRTGSKGQVPEEVYAVVKEVMADG
jgi:hypothetical protein